MEESISHEILEQVQGLEHSADEPTSNVRPDSRRAVAAGVSVLLALAEHLATRSEACGIARDRVLIPEVRVSDVAGAVAGLRNQVLEVTATACEAGAKQLTSAQKAMRSKVTDRI